MASRRRFATFCLRLERRCLRGAVAPPLAPSLVLLDDAELFSVQPLALLHLPMVRAGAPFMTSDAPARSPRNIEISAKRYRLDWIMLDYSRCQPFQLSGETRC